MGGGRLRIMEKRRYTCVDYRQEMMLAGLRKQLHDPFLDEREKERIKEQVRRLETEMGLS